jgi:hypothetical protein
MESFWIAPLQMTRALTHSFLFLFRALSGSALCLAIYIRITTALPSHLVQDPGVQAQIARQVRLPQQLDH